MRDASPADTPAETFPVGAALLRRVGTGAMLLFLLVSFPTSLPGQEDANRAGAYTEALRYTFQWLQERDVLPDVRQFKFDPNPRGRDQMSEAVATVVTENLGLAAGEYEITCPGDPGEKYEEGCRLPDDEKGFISAELASLQHERATVSTEIYYASEPGGRLAFLGLTLELERSSSGDGWVVREHLSTEYGRS